MKQPKDTDLFAEVFEDPTLAALVGIPLAVGVSAIALMFILLGGKPNQVKNNQSPSPRIEVKQETGYNIRHYNVLAEYSVSNSHLYNQFIT